MKTLFILLVCTWVVYISKAQPLIGLDPSFANNGIYTGDTGVYGHIGVQSDGKILVTGREKRNGVYENVKRLNNDGTVDLSFANGGFFTLIDTGNNLIAWFNSYNFQNNGKIILGGGGKDFIIIQLKSDGSLDSSFGNNGISGVELSGNEIITSTAIQNDGKIVVCGQGQGMNDVLVIARFHSNGNLDSSFGINGLVISNKSTWLIDNPVVNDIAVMNDGKIVVGTKATIDALGGASAFTAIRLLPNGELDTSFNHTGIAYTNYSLGSLLYCKSMRLQSDGKVLLSGYGDSICVVRFDTLGQLDNSFGSGGILKVDQGDGRAMELQPDGKIVVAGIANAGVPNNPGVVLYRRLSDGSPDNSFGINGKISSDDFNPKRSLAEFSNGGH